MKTLAFTCLFFVITFFIYFGSGVLWQPLGSSNGVVTLSDFYYHIALVRAFWFESGVNFYNLDTQIAVLKSLTGQDAAAAMPIGVSPVVLVLWFPFALIAKWNIDFANSLWVGCSVTLLSAALWGTRSHIDNGKPRFLPLLVALLVVAACSTSAIRSVLLGQTSIIAAALLLLLYLTANQAIKEGLRFSLTVVLLLLCLALKPTYFLIGLILALASGRWKESAASCLSLFLVFLSLTPKLGPTWPSAYLYSLHVYTQSTIPEAYAQSLVFETTNSFKSAFLPFIGIELATSFATLIYSIGILSLLILALCLNRHTSRQAANAPMIILTLSIAAYLLFAPYVGAYEDLLLVVPLGLLPSKSFPRLNQPISLAPVLLMFLALNHTAFPLDKPLWPFWCAKLLLVCFFLHWTKLSKQQRRPV